LKHVQRSGLCNKVEVVYKSQSFTQQSDMEVDKL